MSECIRNSLFFSILLIFSFSILLTNTSLGQKIFNISDRFDSRPERSILYIGNSRTFYNNMPAMVRKIADSAKSSEKYHIVMHAIGGARLIDHWNNQNVQNLLKQKWSDVVIQEQSGAQLNDEDNSNFHTYGARLVQEIRLSGAKPALFVTWQYNDNNEVYAKYPYFKTKLFGLIQSNHQLLANNSGAYMVNVGNAWERLRLYHPAFSLYEPDGNHPSIYGSYLTALMFYKYFSGNNLSQVSYIPKEIKPDEAILIKKIAQEM